MPFPEFPRTLIRRIMQIACCGLIASAFAATDSAALASSALNCHIGTYRLARGGFVDIAPSDGKTLRWRRFDGTTGALHRTASGDWIGTYGWTDRSDGTQVSFSDCKTRRIDFNGVAGRRIAFDVTNTTFQSRGTKLAGRLVMPRGTAKVPVVVLIHGSERDSALVYYYLQRTLPAEGIGVFVYDKRGTGISGGTYTQDFSLLADDAVAAMREARRLAGARLRRIGYQGGSEGGWVAPIAANRAPVDFVIVCFGLAVNVIDEDQQGVELQMRERGYSAKVISQALEVARAAETVIASGFTRGFARFTAVKNRYRNQPWFKDVRGDYTWLLLPYSTAQLRAMAPKYKWGTPFRYDPMPTLRADTVPQLWILGGEDYEAPSAVTREHIKSLIAEDRPFTLAYYPHAEHGMTLFESKADGTRVSTRYAPGYFAMMRDFIRDGRLHDRYGDSVVTAQRASVRHAGAEAKGN